MWTLFPELLGPILVAFVLGSLVAWALLGLVLPKAPAEDAGSTTPSQGP